MPTETRLLDPPFGRFAPLRWLAIIANVALAVLVCLGILFIEIHNPIAAGTLIGFLFAQILLAAVWTVLSPMGMFSRVMIGSVFVGFLCLCMYRCAYRDGPGTAIAVAIAGAMLLQWVLYQIPLWYLRLTGWKLVTPGQSPVAPRSELQFGIKHLLIWMTVIGVLLGIARFAIPHLQIQTSKMFDAVSLGLYLTLGNSVIALPIVWGCLSKKYFWLWVAITIIVCCLVSVVESTTNNSSLPKHFLWMINGSQTTLSILAMLALRFTGYRLQIANV